MNKNIIISISIIVVLLAVAGFLRFYIDGDEAAWLCENGQWVKHGNPASPMPAENCGISQTDIIVESPQPNETVASPLILKGRARGSWFFEASAPVKLLDDKGNLIAVGYIQAQGEWMTNDFVPFEGKLEYTYTKTSSGTLMFEKDNPSGLPENAKEIRIPVNLVPAKNMAVKVFFGNSTSQGYSCEKVFEATRLIPQTSAPARAALEEMLKGPTAAEQNEGLFTSINPGVKIQKLTIANGVASVDFDEKLQELVGGCCRCAAIRAQITETLKQFSTVKSVVISIDGRTEDILQP